MQAQGAGASVVQSHLGRQELLTDRAEQEPECRGSPPLSPCNLGKIHLLSKSLDPPQTHFAAMSNAFDSGPQKALGGWATEGHSPDTASPGVLDLRKGADVLALDQGGGGR